MDADSVHEKVLGEVEATADQGARAASRLLASFRRIAEEFAGRTAPQLPAALQQPVREHAVPALAGLVALTLVLALGAASARTHKAARHRPGTSCNDRLHRRTPTCVAGGQLTKAHAFLGCLR